MVSTSNSGTGGKGNGGAGEASDGGMLQRVIWHSGGWSSYPTLTKTNYC
jgi:hypothetical protein